MRVVLTAGFDRAPNTLALCELLRRDGLDVAGVVVVTALSLKRLRALARQRGRGAVTQAARRLLGFGKAAQAESPVSAWEAGGPGRGEVITDPRARSVRALAGHEPSWEGAGAASGRAGA